jgi:hypothetical protein
MYNILIIILQGLVKSAEFDMLGHIRVLASSKFTHAQFAAKRLFEILLEDDWIAYLMDKYSSTELLCQVKKLSFIFK